MEPLREPPVWCEGGGADPANITWEPRTERFLQVDSAGCPRYRTHECRTLYGTGVVPQRFYDAFVSFRGQGRFCLAGKGKTDPNGQGNFD